MRKNLKTVGKRKFLFVAKNECVFIEVLITEYLEFNFDMSIQR